MDGYEQLIQTMREEGSKNNPSSIQLGEMESATTCSIGKLILSGSDLLVAEHLKTGYHKSVSKEDPKKKDDDTFVNGLSKGDKVAVYRISDELYIILEKLVSV